jgi:hypothetical protein
MRVKQVPGVGGQVPGWETPSEHLGGAEAYRLRLQAPPRARREALRNMLRPIAPATARVIAGLQ